MADENVKYISKITLPNKEEYLIKDSEARDLIGTIQAGSVVWAGITTTEITDGSATPTSVVIDGKTVKATKGLMVAYKPEGEEQSREFIYNGEIWQELGGMGMLKALAYKDSVSASYTPSGTNAASSVSFTGGTNDVVLGEATTFTNGTSLVSFSGGTSDSVLGSSTTFSATGTGVSFGNHSTATVLKSDVTATVPKPSGTTSYLKATTAKTGTKSINQVTAAGSTGKAASWNATVAAGTENLVFSWTTNTPSTPCSYGAVTVGTGNDSVATGIAAAESTDTGAISYISAVGTSGTNNVTFTTSGHTASAITGLGTITVTDPTVTSNADDAVTAVTSIGTGTAAAQKITVGTNDKVTAVTGIGTGTAAAQKFTGSAATITST